MSTLIVVPAKNGERLYFEGKWRHEGRQKKRRLGPAWIEPREAPIEVEGWQRLYRKRRGRPANGHLTPEEAAFRLQEAIDEQPKPRVEQILFEDAAETWLQHEENVEGAKHSTLRDYKAMLHDPEREPRRRGRKPAARLMKKWKGVSVETITTAQIDSWLRELDKELSPRSVNKYRQVLGQILGHVLKENPVEATKKRRQPEAKEIVVYSVEQIRKIEWRTDLQTAAMIRVAAFAGLRMGELLALRWRDIDWSAKKIRVSRSYTPGHGEVTPKGRKARGVPLAAQVARALEMVRERKDFVGPNALVFCNALGDHIDPTTLRTAYKEARKLAREKDPEIPELRFHDLRHTFGTLAVAKGIDLLTVKEWMGHRDIQTTMIYLHYAENADDAKRLSDAFTPREDAE
jgi:integrase